MSAEEVSESKKIRKQNIDIFEQKIHPLENLLREKRMPILFIGSGISKRYLNNTTWEELLEKIASVLKIDRFQLNGIKKKIESDNPQTDVMPLLASKLSEIMINMISEKTLTHDDFPDMSAEDWNLMEKNNPFKVAICSILKNGMLTNDLKLVKEIESFKKVSSKIPAVITTNYDDFLEKNIFTDFEILVYPDDYYFSGSDGYNEILKIHGTIDKPDSIVITKDDYDKFFNESKVITSRLTYLMCNHPMIFVGYSLGDKEILDIIHNIMTSMKQQDINKVKGRLIKIKITESLKKSKWNNKIIDYDNKRIEVMELEIPTPEILFRYLDRFTPIASASEIKKYKNMIRDIVLSTDSTSKRITVINEGSLGTMGPNDFAVVFGNTESIKSIMRGITGYEIEDVLLDVLNSRRGLLDTSKVAFLEWIQQTRISSGNKYIPIFHYYSKFDIDYREMNENIRIFTERMISGISQILDGMGDECKDILNEEEIDVFLESKVKSFSRCKALMFFQSKGVIDRETCRRKLLKGYNDGEFINDKGRMKSELRCAITYLDMQDYMGMLRAKPRTLSH